MPTYEYECDKCGGRFDRFQSMTDKPVKRCPKCGGKVRRLLGVGAGVIFKGSGFYETDYKRKGSGKDGKEESTVKKDAKSETKSKTKTDKTSSKDISKKTD